MAIDYTHLTGPQAAEKNMGGTKQKIYIAPVRDFESIKTLKTNPANLNELAEISGNHTFKTGKCFKEVYCTLDKGEINDEPQGERDGKSFKTSAKIFYPGSMADATGFANQVINDKFIVLVPMPDGKVRQIGSEDFYAEIVPKFGSGTNSGGVRGFELAIESMGADILLYPGTIQLTPTL